MFTIEIGCTKFVAYVDSDGVTGVDVIADGRIVKSEMFRATWQATDWIYNHQQ